jgi:hypothetical protein
MKIRSLCTISAIALFFGCKDGYREEFGKKQYQPKSRTDKRLVIGIGPNLEGSELNSKLNADRKVLHGNSGKTNVEIVVEKYFGSESHAEIVSFAFDSSNFEAIRISDSSKRKVYYSTSSFGHSVPATECYFYRLHIQKIDSTRWYVSGSLSVDLPGIKLKKTRKIELSGMFRAAYFQQ